MAAVLLVACNAFVRDKQVDADVRSAFDQLRAHQDAPLTNRFDPRLRSPQTATQLAALERYVPAGDPKARKPISTSTFRVIGQGETVSTVDEYDYGDRRALVSTVMYRAAPSGPWLIRGLHVQVATAAELARNRLSLIGKSPTQYGFFAFAILSPVLMALALIKVIRTQGLKRKWLWCVVALAGLCALQMNWTTGQVSFHLISIQLIGAGAMRGLSAFSPWIISATIPVGAILILSGLLANPARAKRSIPKAPAEALG